jgi:hypothetical protein
MSFWEREIIVVELNYEAEERAQVKIGVQNEFTGFDNKNITRGSVSDQDLEEKAPEHKSDGNFKTKSNFIDYLNVMFEPKN